MSATAATATDLAPEHGLPPASIEARLEQVEAFGAQVNEAISSLVDSLLELKARDHTADLEALRTKLAQMEQQLNQERTARELAEISQIHPKERRVVFVGGAHFGDNTKYAWQALRERAAAMGVECWFMPHDATQEALVRGLGGDCFPGTPEQWSDADVTRALGTAVLVIHDHLLHPNPLAPSLFAGARMVQLWHGISIKEVGLRNLPALKNFSPRVARILRTCGRFASFVGGSRADEANWRRWFSFERYAPIGFPRNDVMHREPSAIDLVNVDEALLERMRAVRRAGKRVFFYAPTFRDADRGRWLLDAGMERVAKGVAAAGDLLVMNLHPVEQAMQPKLEPALPGVVFVRPRSDIYPLMRETDALITDYSSLMFDYLHLDRPIVLFRPDHASYIAKSRKLYDAKLAELPGPMVSTAQALVEVLKHCEKRCGAPFKAARDQLAAQLFDHIDGQAAERVVDLIAAELDTALAQQAQG